MNDFVLEVNQTEEWAIDKNLGLLPALTLFLFFLALFLISAFQIYLLEQSTNLLVILIPLLPGFLAFYSAKFVLRSLFEYPEKLEFRLSGEGISCKVPERKEEKFLAWTQIKQYDQLKPPTTALFSPQLEKIRLRVEVEEGLDVIAFSPQMNLVQATLQQYNVPFGYLRN
jgi:hypothetical protein